MAAKTRAQACTTGMSRARDGIDHELADARIDEHDLDHDHADDEIGEVDGDHVGYGAQALGKAWRRMMRRWRDALEPRHLDIGAGKKIDDGGPGHAHHMGDDDQDERHGRQRAAIDDAFE